MATDKNLLEKVRLLGVPLLETEDNVDANVTLAEVVRSKELRLRETFPVLLANSAEKNLFNYPTAKTHLSKKEKGTLDNLLFMSLGLYNTLGLKFSWAEKLLQHLPSGDDTVKEMSKKLKGKEEFKVGDILMSPGRLVTTFQNYFQKGNRTLDSLLFQKDDFALEYALSQVFPPKQKELFLKKVRGETLSKTEREYYSRSVRKKVLALMNERLHQLAKSLY